MNSSTSIFVDTNFFLRYLLDDEPAMAEKAEALFQRAVAGEVLLTTSLLVIAEIVWTLESFYQLARSEIATKVEAILSLPNLDCSEAETLLQALDLYVSKNIDFVDAYNACDLKNKGIQQIATFDRKHFRRVQWLEVIEV